MFTKNNRNFSKINIKTDLDRYNYKVSYTELLLIPRHFAFFEKETGDSASEGEYK